MPVLNGKFLNSSMAASNPPAEPPMPTIGQFKFSLAVRELAVFFGDFGTVGFLWCTRRTTAPLRARDLALSRAFRFAAIYFYVNCGLAFTQGSIAAVARCPDGRSSTMLEEWGYRKMSCGTRHIDGVTKAAEHRRTPQRKRVTQANKDGPRLDAGKSWFAGSCLIALVTCRNEQHRGRTLPLISSRKTALTSLPLGRTLKLTIFAHRSVSGFWSADCSPL